MENKIQLAVKAFSEATKPNISKLAREFDVPYHRLRARIHGRQSHADRAKATRSLDSIQEKALTSWIQTLDSAHISSTPKMIEEAANRMLKNAGEDRVVGHSWVYRFIARHPDLNYILQKQDLAAEGSPPLGFPRRRPPRIFQARPPIHRQIQLSGLRSSILSFLRI